MLYSSRSSSGVRATTQKTLLISALVRTSLHEREEEGDGRKKVRLKCVAAGSVRLHLCRHCLDVQANGQSGVHPARKNVPRQG